ncbi:MAG TPA: acyl--CoA ligase family protein, partial [Anaerolineae bacterium]
YVFREKEAVVYGSQRWTYPEFAARVNRLANALRDRGLQKGDRVGFLCPNTPPLLEAHFGVPLAGGILVALNTRLAADDIRHILNHAGVQPLFVDTELAHLIAPIRDQLETVETIVNIVDHAADAPGETLPGLEYEAFLETGRPDPVESWLEDELETISINYTSGTTGNPKGVMYTYRGAYLNALGEALEMGMDSNSVYLWTLPMFHCNGWCFTWGVVAVGGTQVCLRKFDPAQVIPLITQEKVSQFCGAPTVLIMLANDPAIKTLQLSHPLRITTAAAPPSPTIIQTMEALGIAITHVYGLTETYGPHSICEWQAAWDEQPAEERARLKARQGVPYIHAAEMRVVDDDMQDVPADAATIGEVIMRGNNVMKGYFNNPEGTAQAFRGGWFHSGDLAVMHPDGYIELRDRAKDIIISGGENISTIEVEQMVAKHPAVLEVAVIAIPHETWGEVPKAFVTLKADVTATEADIIGFCREHMAHFKCPKAVEFGPLPKTSTGKVQKFRLREKEWAAYEKRVH